MPDQPEGGHDDIPLRPTGQPAYTVRITFHRATNLPAADLNTGSSDPFVLASLHTSLPTRHSQDPGVTFRTRTVQRDVEPVWDQSWVVAGVPPSGFSMQAWVYDEDPKDHDDVLGRVDLKTGPIDERWGGIKQGEFKVKKRGANLRAYAPRWCVTLVKGHDHLHAHMIVSVEVIGKTEKEVGKIYTVNCFWRQHYSPLIGKLAGTKGNGTDGVERADFQANEIQLQGPVPNEMYHRFVDFRNFVHGMFEATGVRGRLLHKALHHQHNQIYNFDKRTQYGELPGPGPEMTLKFLELCHFDQGGRVFTYVITLDGLFRFTETGKEFGIDLLSKHTMHSDVDIYIAWSGEFLIRRLKNPDQPSSAPDQETHAPDEIPGGPPNAPPPRDPAHYELVIDNDSGTYRPLESLLPIFKSFLERNLPGLHITTMSCTDDALAKIKDEQRAVKQKEGDRRVYGQGSRSGSVSSSDASSLASRAEDMEGGEAGKSKKEKAFEFVEEPKQGLKDLVPGEKERGERERTEERADEAAKA